jgi:hypothetical protein
VKAGSYNHWHGIEPQGTCFLSRERSLTSRKVSSLSALLVLWPPWHQPLTDQAQVSMLQEKMVLKITSVLASGRRIQARCKHSVKVTEKFIRKGIHFQQTESRLSPE